MALLRSKNENNFADTGYWIALLDPHDALHQKAIDQSVTLVQEQICTSEMVFIEVLNHFSKRSSILKRAAAALIQSAQKNTAVEIVPQTSELFEQALILYKQRIDHAWSHTDCTSFCIMKQQNILEALAYDKHFDQAGFLALLR